MLRIKFLTVIGGIVLFVVGVQEFRLASAAAKDPHRISCADLAAKGPGDNAHVTLTDFFLCDQSYVYESRSKKETARWSKVWIPAVPTDGEYMRRIVQMAGDGSLGKGPVSPPTDIRVLVKSTHVKSPGEVDALSGADTLTGLIVNKIESIGTKERKILAESYPGIDFTRCYILDHDRKPAGAAKVAGMLGGGALLALAGGAWLVAGRKG